MGLFSKNDPTPASGPVPEAAPAVEVAPLSHERVIAALDAQGYRYMIDSEGDIGGIWDDHVFYFVRIGNEQQLLQVRGRWTRTVAADQYAAVLELVNDWNIEKVFPKTYVRVEDGALGVYAEHSVDYLPGLTDAQLQQHLACAVSTALAFFGRLDEAYPQAVAEHKARIAASRSEG